jgi:hypothetical protein
VTVRDFIDALETPNAKPERVNEYIQGAFPEWEPVPSWFREIVNPKE